MAPRTYIHLHIGGPADLSGSVHAGDVLLRVDDLDISDHKKHQIVSLLKGRAGTKVTSSKVGTSRSNL
jgi:C-terminal processing protease CtpA/Prc